MITGPLRALQLPAVQLHSATYLKYPGVQCIWFPLFSLNHLFQLSGSPVLLTCAA